MEIIGSMSSRVNYLFARAVVVFEDFEHSGLPQKIKEKYSFSELHSNRNREMVGWEGGLFTHGSREIVVSQAFISGHEDSMSAVVMGDSNDSKAFLDSLCDFIDSFHLFGKLHDAEKDVSYSTTGRVKLDVSPTVLINRDYLNFLQKKSKELETEYYDIELQPVGIAVALLFKPNLSKISKLSLDVTKMTRIMRGATSKEIQLAIGSIEDYSNCIYTFGMRLDSETVKNMLTDLEKQLGKS
jgi:hypothetical protein